MKSEISGFESAAQAIPRRIAVLADGENLSFSSAHSLMQRVDKIGEPIILRAYCDRLRPNGWEKDHRFQVTYLDTLSGKNSADIRLVIDAMDIAHAQVVNAFVILSTDRDFAPLAHRLRSMGYWVLGAGRSETSPQFRAACSDFHVIESCAVGANTTVNTKDDIPAVLAIDSQKTKAKSKETNLKEKAHSIIAKHCDKDGWLAIQRFGPLFTKETGSNVNITGGKTWRAFLLKHPETFNCEPKGPTARVRLVTPSPHTAP